MCWQTDTYQLFHNLRCAKCGNRFKIEPPTAQCSCCKCTVNILASQLVDLLGNNVEQAEAILNWPANIHKAGWRESELLNRMPNGSVSADPELVRLGIVTPGSQLTELGAKLVYHVSEYRIQKNDLQWLGLIDRAGIGRDARVLDVGCGVGQTLKLLQERTSCVCVGLDWDLEALAFGSRWTSVNGKCASFVAALSDRLPFPDGLFTHVICRVALNYMHQASALAEMTRVLVRQGLLLLRVEGPGFDCRMIRDSHSVRERFVRLYDLVLGLGLEMFGCQPVPGGVLRGGRSFGTPRRIQKLLGSACRVTWVEPISQYVGLTCSYHLLARRV